MIASLFINTPVKSSLYRPGPKTKSYHAQELKRTMVVLKQFLKRTTGNFSHHGVAKRFCQGILNRRCAMRLPAPLPNCPDQSIWTSPEKPEISLDTAIILPYFPTDPENIFSLQMAVFPSFIAPIVVLRTLNAERLLHCHHRLCLISIFSISTQSFKRALFFCPVKTVLVIEDQKPVRESIGDLLALAGCKTRLIGDGQAALAALLETPFDLITLDLNMPSLDGISLLETLAAGEGPNSKTPIVVISAYLSPQTSEILKQFGIVHCLSKPFEIENLLDIVRSLINP